LSSCTKPNDAATVGNILELLLWSGFQYYNHFFISQYPEIFVPFRQTLFFETARSHQEPIQRNIQGYSISIISFWGQKQRDGEDLVSWSIVVENPIIGPKFGHFSAHSFM
jgi:hypothetical protein